MQYTYILIGLLLFVAACAQPPSDHATATITDTREQPVANEQGTGTEEAETANDATPVNPDISSFEFEGYGPGKSHVGTFEELSGELIYVDGKITVASGVIQAASVKSDSSGLDNHLRSDDFFHVEQYPTIEWASASIARNSGEATDTDTNTGVMIGTLTFLGTTKSITIPVTFEEKNGREAMSADFLLDTNEFGMSYTGVNKDVRIAFTVAG